MTDLTPEVMNALVRLMRGEIDYDALDNDALFAIAAAAKGGRKTLHEVTVKLNQRGFTFAQIGERLGAVESTASRWAKPRPDAQTQVEDEA